MDYSVAITLGFLVFAIVMFALEKIPLSITAMIVAVGLHLSGVLTATEAFKGFVDSNVIVRRIGMTKPPVKLGVSKNS